MMMRIFFSCSGRDRNPASLPRKARPDASACRSGRTLTPADEGLLVVPRKHFFFVLFRQSNFFLFFDINYGRISQWASSSRCREPCFTRTKHTFQCTITKLFLSWTLFTRRPVVWPSCLLRRNAENITVFTDAVVVIDGGQGEVTPGGEPKAVATQEGRSDQPPTNTNGPPWQFF